jgi:peptidylprolyl isomerase
MFKRSVILVVVLFVVGAVATSAQKRSSKSRTVVKKPVVVKPVVLSSGAVKTASGLIYLITKQGTGDVAKPGQIVSVHYTGTLTDGTKFDSSRDRGRPIEFPLGVGRVIKGWDEGIGKMRVGDQAIFVIPSSIAYGPGGRGPIPPDATLIFIVELAGIKDAPPPN